jgi:hypothetical protein
LVAAKDLRGKIHSSRGGRKAYLKFELIIMCAQRQPSRNHRRLGCAGTSRQGLAKARAWG